MAYRGGCIALLRRTESGITDWQIVGILILVAWFIASLRQMEGEADRG